MRLFHKHYVFYTVVWLALTGLSEDVRSQAAPLPASASASTLLQRYSMLESRLNQNAYGRPLMIESNEGDNRVSGHAYAVMDFPFATVATQLQQPSQWCEVMILHLNTKYCRAEPQTSVGSPEKLDVRIGKKTPQALGDTTPLVFTFKLADNANNFLSAAMLAQQGPFGTSDYQMALQAIPLPNGRTFVHLQYAYGYGLAGRLAMQAYLATTGRSKIGFTALPSAAAAPSRYVGGLRGAVERNAMRYYLAIEAYMASLQSPQAEQVSKRFDDWYTATEAFAPQLHEIDKASYLAMKKAEYQRQQSPI